MSIYEQLLEKWQLCREKRYPVLFIITAPLDTLVSMQFKCTNRAGDL
jgi:hypothetical protein